MLRSYVRPRFLFLALLAVAAGAIASAMTVDPPSFPALVAESSSIVRARVSSVETRRTPTPTGDAIKTFVTFDIDRPLKGTTDRTVTLSFLGGTVGDETWEIAGMPRFTPGSEEFLFISRGSQICPLVGAMHGRYRVLTTPETGQAYVARDDFTPLVDVADVSRAHDVDTALGAPPREALSPAAFERLIAREITRPTRPELQR